jgi:hypothetical protein
MKIVTIFETVKGCLLSVRYDAYDSDEFKRIMRNWNDAEYLENYFEEHKGDLQNGYLRDMTIDEAIEITIFDANELESTLIEIAKKGIKDETNTLQTLFEPLHRKEKTAYRIPTHQKSKFKGYAQDSWLRIYAIRIAPNVFVITGGAIKLTPDMNERDHLLEELQKLEITRKFLEDNDLFDESDFEYLEL